MHILALETTERTASIAALEGPRVLLATQLDPTRRSAQTLIPGIQQLLQDVGWKPAEIQLIGLTIGPGSFTGLRVGVTAAKTLAYVTGAEVMGINTLEVIAAQSSAEAQEIWAVLDAQRSQVYAAQFSRAGDRVALRRETSIEDVDAWLAMVRPGQIITGPYLSQLAGRLPQAAVAAPEEQWAPTAASVGRLTWERFTAGDRQNLWQLVPHYYRQSAAEEKLAAQVPHP